MVCLHTKFRLNELGMVHLVRGSLRTTIKLIPNIIRTAAMLLF
jgi:hypothetical protein